MSAPDRHVGLAELLQPWHQAPLSAAVGDLPLSGLALDSRQVEPGYLYLALPGATTHGLRYADSAVQRGAVAVLASNRDAVDHAALLQALSVPVVLLDNLKAHVAHIAARFHGEPSHRLRVVGVTGTDGKSSTCRFVQQALQSLGVSCGYVGTLGWGMQATGAQALSPLDLTTPDPVLLQALLAQLLRDGANTVTLEASSHGIAESRLDAVRFEIAVLTNLGRDHLDYHGTLEAYRASKVRLFHWPDLQAMVVNGGDDLGRSLLSDDRAPARRIGFNTAALQADNVQLTDAGLHFNLIDTGQRLPVISPLVGRFNVDNLLACHGVLRLLGYSASDAAQALTSISPVAGRMERFAGELGPVAVVDFAHTPQALQAALDAARQHCRGRLWVVFGCGGDRDPGKRGPMGRAAEAADELVVTDDNPRTEEAAGIRRAILAGMHEPMRAREIADRREAIQSALGQAQTGDLVLVAGKGHENFQIVGTERRPFSDRDIVRQTLGVGPGQS